MQPDIEYAKARELAIKMALPHVLDGVRSGNSLFHILTRVYWQGVMNGVEIMDEGSDDGE